MLAPNDPVQLCNGCERPNSPAALLKSPARTVTVCCARDLLGIERLLSVSLIRAIFEVSCLRQEVAIVKCLREPVGMAWEDSAEGPLTQGFFAKPIADWKTTKVVLIKSHP